MERNHWPSIYQGARAPLLDRLMDLDLAAPTEPQPLRTLTRQELHASVRREVERLLNTRCGLPASLLDTRERTVIDYGIADFSALSPQNAEDRERLARSIAYAIAAFEPRLRQVRVTLEPPHQDMQRVLVARIEAVLVVESVTEPIAFPVVMRDDSVEHTET
jgi:type VI secretion system lysozyme-like protein